MVPKGRTKMMEGDSEEDIGVFSWRYSESWLSPEGRGTAWHFNGVCLGQSPLIPVWETPPTSLAPCFFHVLNWCGLTLLYMHRYAITVRCRNQHSSRDAGGTQWRRVPPSPLACPFLLFLPLVHLATALHLFPFLCLFFCCSVVAFGGHWPNRAHVHGVW